MKTKPGDVHGEWTVLEFHSRGGSNHHDMWKCVCSCGKQVVVDGSHLRRGVSTRCKSCVGKRRFPKGVCICPLMQKPIEKRFEGKYIISMETGCWDWTGAQATQGKYGIIGITGSHDVKYAHVLAWEMDNKRTVPTTAPPDGSSRWEIHHTCENHQCVNPEHLQLVTSKQHKKIHLLRAPRTASKHIPGQEVMKWPGFCWERVMTGPAVAWGWSAEL